MSAQNTINSTRATTQRIISRKYVNHKVIEWPLLVAIKF